MEGVSGVGSDAGRVNDILYKALVFSFFKVDKVEIAGGTVCNNQDASVGSALKSRPESVLKPKNGSTRPITDEQRTRD